MYLDPWMVVTLILSFGACAVISRRSGFAHGAMTTLHALVEQKMIQIDDEGVIKRWTPYAELPTKKKSARKVAK